MLFGIYVETKLRKKHNKFLITFLYLIFIGRTARQWNG